jgi:hypothetical protein
VSGASRIVVRVVVVVVTLDGEGGERAVAIVDKEDEERWGGKLRSGRKSL